MTLGGLALAVGILVDDATVTIENINLHLEQGKDVMTAIMDGAAQIATPAFVLDLCICIVFVPMFSLRGVAGYLFIPMASVCRVRADRLLHALADGRSDAGDVSTHTRTLPEARLARACWVGCRRNSRTGFQEPSRRLSQPADGRAGATAAGS